MGFQSLLVLFVISFVANLFSAFSGGGAGLIQLPALIFLGLPFGIALATHKVAAVALGVGAAVRHLKEGSLQRQFCLFMLLTGLPGVFIGANIILQIPDRVAQTALGVLTIGLGIYSILSPQLGQVYRPRNQTLYGYAIGGAGLFLIGVLNGSLTSGTGLFVTFWIVSWFGLDYRRAVSYVLVLVGVFWNGLGAVTLGVLGEIKWEWVGPLVVGALVGGYVGAHLSIKKGNKWIKRGFETVTILVGLKLLIS